MNGIDAKELDEVIAKTYQEIRTAVGSHSEKSIHMYSRALTALLELRRQVVAQDPTAG
ncbi:hypothetical protein ACN20G_30160 (plasmid) [Streptomyces sp. BI20]|uniref:hypothetical protein n=1 Tax=Streptomyces sp. BI20 TaxID=3403460 RepID=UPI003C710501